MGVHRWNEAEFEQLTPSIRRQAIHGQELTIARFRIAQGTHIEQHQHVNEQVATVLSGKMRFVVGDGEEHVVSEGESILLPPNVPHSADALEDCDVIDAFAPVRSDWISGDDAYLRR